MTDLRSDGSAEMRSTPATEGASQPSLGVCTPSLTSAACIWRASLFPSMSWLTRPIKDDNMNSADFAHNPGGGLEWEVWDILCLQGAG